MQSDLVIMEEREGYASIELNRPEKLNALTPTMLSALRGAITLAVQDSRYRAILLTGRGKGFCSGKDITARPANIPEDPSAKRALELLYNPIIRAIVTSEKPVICAVNGVAAGAGANIALACDFVLAGRSARFIQSFVKIGLIPDCGGTYFLPRLVGRARALGLTMLGDGISAEEAAAMGMIWRCTDDDALEGEARALALRLSAMPPIAVSLIKKAVSLSLQNDLDAQLELERECQAIARETEDYKEGLKAFAEKRTPAFRGR
jgi:2-(1,2-epoxy-1,2-dihydrophenyl)acetyl-CoA isomerase